MPVIGTPTEAEKKKVEKLKDGAITLVLSPHSSLIPSMSAALLLPSSPQVQVVDLGDGGSSDNTSSKSNEATRKTIEEKKGRESAKLIS